MVSAAGNNPQGTLKTPFRRKAGPRAPPPSKSIDEIWAEAMDEIVKEYNLSVRELEQWDGRLGEGETGTERAKALFEDSRHPGDRKDKVMKAVGGCFDWIEDGLEFVRNNVSGSYAVPAQIVTGSISYMIQAAQDVSDDFDLIESTFETLDNALGEIGDLRRFNFKFDSQAFLERLTAIFVSMVKLCSLSGKVFLSSRKKRWLRALVKGRDEQIQDACAAVEKAIKTFRGIVPIQTLGQIQIMSNRMDDMPDRFVEQLQTKMKYSDLQPLWTRSQKSLDVIRDTLKRSKFFHPEVEARVEDMMKQVEKQLVEGTFSWTENEPAYTAWESGRKAPYLFVLGNVGSGKTFFTCHCYRSIQKRKLKSISSDEGSDRKVTQFVTYFPFKIGREESQDLGSVLAYTVFQVAMQDMRLRDSIANDLATFKESDKGKDADPDRMIKFLWQNLLVRKFERTAEASRELFILLDGIEIMDQTDRKTMLDLFQELSPERCGIRILMTGTESVSISKKGVGLPACPVISLDEKIKKEKDIERIIQSRIAKSERLKSFKESVWTMVEQKVLESPNPISTVDIIMAVMEQADDEKYALETIKKLTTQTGLYDAMIRSVLNKRSDKQREFFQFIFSICTFSFERPSLYVLQEFAKQESTFQNTNLDVAEQIDGPLSNFLYATNRSDEKRHSEEDMKEQMVTFRQAAFREHLGKTKSDLIPDPLKSKVFLFVKLTNILCGGDTEISGLRDVWQHYAARWLTEHLRDIDVKATQPPEGCEVVESLARLFHNEGKVSRVFENYSTQSDYDHDTGLDIYDLSVYPETAGGGVLKMLQEWAKKMNFHDEEELSSQAREWVRYTIHEPRKMLDKLLQGHFQRWIETKTYEEAKVPHELICRALRLRLGFGQDEKPGLTQVTNLTQVKTVLRYARTRVFMETPIQAPRCRIAAALVLYNTSKVGEEGREYARKLYQSNIEDEITPGPERFYSYLGLAEHYYKPEGEEESLGDTISSRETQRWDSVLQYADQALSARSAEKGALGSDLNEERCIRAFVLKAHALSKLNRDEEMIQTCELCSKEGFQYNSQILELLSFLIDVYAKNSQWAKMIDFVWQQSPLVQAEFICLIFVHGGDVPIIVRRNRDLQKAAFESKRVDYLIRMLEGAIEYLQDQGSPYSGLLRRVLAQFYYRVVRASKMAEHLMTKDIQETGIFSALYSFLVFRDVINIYHENFTNSTLKNARLDAIESLQDLMKQFQNNTFQETSRLADGELVLSKMYLELGNNEQAEAHINRAFDTCITDLEDSVDSNDPSAFRVLAKVLAFLGLEMEAKVAISLQFSRVGGNDDGQSSSEEINPGSPNLSLADDGSFEGHGGDEKEDVDPLDAISVLIEEDQISEDLEPGRRASESSIKPIVNGHSISNGDSNDEPIIATEAPQSPSAEIDQPHSPPETPQPKESNILFSQDVITDVAPVTCDGVCSPMATMDTFEAKGKKFIICLDCADTDFCEDCYEKQVTFFDKGEDGFWFKCCWTRHEYLMGPIDGWLGVKNGVIHIGNQKLQWADWLLYVKGRWKRKIKTPGIWDEIRSRERPRLLS